MKPKVRSWIVLGLALSLAATACGQSATEPPVATEAPIAPPDPMAMYAPAAVTGDIIAAGSSTVYPLTEAVAELFRDEGYTGNITIDSIGSGAGFERFCVAGETDISNASRPIKDEEIASCRSIGREPLEFRVGTDALAVVVNSENTFLTDVTLEQLAQIFSTAQTWADVDPAWPAEPILRFSPGTDSGTFDYFVEEVFDGEEAPLLAAASLQLSEDDNVLVQGVEGSPYAIGYFGYAYYQENADRLTVLSVEGVAPSAESVDSADYPLARPLFIYTTAEILQGKPQVAAFVYFYLTRVNQVIDEVGYFPAAEEALAGAMQVWQDAVGQ
ncbi:MAG: phosphate-binding protein [Chloroflexi bacterium RBG_13_68_17]|nr:MAG: phosphate-binding protein [Chloroflexi bacterium RBG_13_68_17]